MPAFTFEKISPPDRRDPTAEPEKKPQGIMLQLRDRLAERRARRSLRKDAADSREDASE